MDISTNQRLEIEKAIKGGIESYCESRRQMITPFIEEHFSFKGAWQINKRAFGWDMAKAPVNLGWAPFYFLLNVVGGTATNKVGLKALSKVLKSLPQGFRTDVESEVEWLLYKEFLELPFEDKENSRLNENNALLSHILSQDELVNLFDDALRPFTEIQNNSTLQVELNTRLGPYVDNRKDVAELATALIAAGTSFAANKSLNVGALGLGQVAAATIAHNMAVSSFLLGETAGGVFYSFFPGAAAASTGLLVGVTGGIATIMALVAAFAGFVTDPAQKALGLHSRKLNRLVDSIEKQLLGDNEDAFVLRDGLATRLFDCIDFLIFVARKLK